MKKKTIREKIAAKIRSARVAAGLTRRELADRTGVTEQTIYNVEMSDRNVRFETLVKINQELNIDELFI